MKKLIEVSLIILIFILLIATIIIIYLKISNISCCSCTPDSYKFQPIISTLQKNKYIDYTDCAKCNSLRCSPSNWVIPSDLVFLILVFLIALAFIKYKF